MIRLACLAFAAFFCLPALGADMDVQVLRDLPQVRFPAPNRVVSGALDASHLDAVQRAGIRHVVSLRPAEENPKFDEAQAVGRLGLEYHELPIEGAQSLTKENAEAFDRILKEIGDESALLHCSSGNRVGALIAIREAWIRGESPEQAIAKGKRWGLTQLEGAVRAVLEEGQG